MLAKKMRSKSIGTTTPATGTLDDSVSGDFGDGAEVDDEEGDGELEEEEEGVDREGEVVVGGSFVEQTSEARARA